MTDREQTRRVKLVALDRRGRIVGRGRVGEEMVLPVGTCRLISLPLLKKRLGRR